MTTPTTAPPRCVCGHTRDQHLTTTMSVPLPLFARPATLHRLPHPVAHPRRKADPMTHPTGADWGWITIFGFAAAHNVIAAGRRQEMLCDAARRHRRAHRILIPTLAGLGYLHVMGWLPRQADPLHWAAVATERAADVARAWRAHAP